MVGHSTRRGSLRWLKRLPAFRWGRAARLAALILAIGSTTAGASVAAPVRSPLAAVAAMDAGGQGTVSGGNTSYVIPPPPPPPQTAGGITAPGIIGAFMRWTFLYTPGYTKVVALIASGISPQALVVVTCTGRGCPFGQRVRAAPQTHGCRAKGKHHCPVPGRVDLTRVFAKRQLRVGARVTVSIVRPGWVGKFYRFTVRSGKGPRIEIACLAPGSARPSGRC